MLHMSITKLLVRKYRVMVTYTAHTKEHGSLLSQSTLESATFDSVRWVTDVLGRQRRLQSISELLSSKPRFFTILWRFYVSTVGVYPLLRDSSTGMPNRPSTKLCKYRRGPFHQTLPRQSSITCMALAINYDGHSESWHRFSARIRPLTMPDRKLYRAQG